MTPKQAWRMMNRHCISVVCVPHPYKDPTWYAGDALNAPILTVDPTREVAEGHITTHCGPTPEIAIEDYCNARNLEWDV